MNQGITMHQAKLHLDTRQLVYCLASFSGMLTFGFSWSDQKATMLLLLRASLQNTCSQGRSIAS